MMDFEALVARCKASVEMTVNGHRAVYETAEEYIGKADYVTPEHLAAFKAGADIYELQVYPSTPIGFYLVVGLSLADVVAQAHAVLDAEKGPVGNPGEGAPGQ